MIKSKWPYLVNIGNDTLHCGLSDNCHHFLVGIPVEEGEICPCCQFFNDTKMVSTSWRCLFKIRKEKRLYE